MNFQNLEFESKLGKPSVYTYRSHPEGARTLAIILPGQAYYKDAPLMWYSALAAFQAGADTLNVEYGYQANRIAMNRTNHQLALDELKDSLSEFLSEHGYENIIMISKSIGTQFASQIGRMGKQLVKNHIFLTPLNSTIEFMKNAGKMLVLVGEKDPLFEKDDILSIKALNNVEIITFPGADHLMEIQGDFNASLKVLEIVTEKCHDFILRQIS